MEQTTEENRDAREGGVEDCGFPGCRDFAETRDHRRCQTVQLVGWVVADPPEQVRDGGGIETVENGDGGSQIRRLGGAANVSQVCQVPEELRHGRYAHILRVPDLIRS